MLRSIIKSTKHVNKLQHNNQINNYSTNQHSIQSILQTLNINHNNINNYGLHYNNQWFKGQGNDILISTNPSNGEIIANINTGTTEQLNDCLQHMKQNKQLWSNLPMPIRGDIVRQIGNELRQYKHQLGLLVSYEMGKIISEGLGEIQECIDICDYAVGLSRTLNGLVLPSERPDHIMLERYNSLNGHVGIITAFNFPSAVYFWNLAISLICGNTNIWKPSQTTSLVGIACTQIVYNVLQKNNINSSIASLICGNIDISKNIVSHKDIELISFTGSTAVGRQINIDCAKQFKCNILELGGNNAMIVMNDANIQNALRAAVFSAVGTAGQRCTSLRRLLIHHSIYENFVNKLIQSYKTIKIGNPLEENNVLCGPLHSQQSVINYENAIKLAKQQGGKLLYGGNRIERSGNYVEPTIIDMSNAINADILQHETFAPVLYVMKFGNLHEAISINNNVPQGLSSSLFTESQQNIWLWTGNNGSDCGIVNINSGPSGAEIGGAFGGNKETGWGRESGSDAWKSYMRRSTIAINYGNKLPLAQGVEFDI